MKTPIPLIFDIPISRCGALKYIGEAQGLRVGLFGVQGLWSSRFKVTIFSDVSG